MTAQRLLSPLFLLLPVTVWLEFTHASPTTIFIIACLAILPLAGLMGESTEHLAHRAGPGLGGLFNATFGNAAELIIAFMALRAGETEIVKASLTGSILGNMLMVLGLAMLLGGWKHKELVFNKLAAETGSGMMVLAVVALVIPAIYAQVTQHQNPGHIEALSLDISFILIATYIASLVFQFRTHARLFMPEDAGSAAAELNTAPVWSLTRSLVTLLVAAGAIGVLSEILVGAVDAAGTALGLGKVFMGVVVVAVVGNAAEHSTAIVVAMKGKMDLAFGIAMGSGRAAAGYLHNSGGHVLLCLTRSAAGPVPAYGAPGLQPRRHTRGTRHMSRGLLSG